ncbi:MAG: nucleoside phosphorylase [Clostridia bacterium]|nr:nucleoside phosphorylase [Clostridia bacterium]MBQ7038619.1 nucleoside phosphorylase [Clostridia bacterium]
MMNFNEERMYHIGLKPSEGAEYAIITGDPGRVESIARLLDEPQFVASNREYTTWAGTLAGHRVLVTSHGIGGPSTAICVEELSRCGVKTLIRVGTCGGMALQVCGGDMVVATGAIRAEGTSREYLPIEFPAVADLAVCNALVSAAETSGYTVHSGVVHCKDSFYGQHSPEASPVSYDLQNKWQSWLRGGCLASEMESATLYTVAASLGLRAGCVLHVVWNQEREKAGLSNPTSEKTDSVAKTAINALKALILA